MKGFLALFLVVAAVVAENQCPSEQETNWDIEYLLRHEDCDKFYKCTYGEPVLQQCPSDLYFNLEKWECDWKSNVDCSGRNDPDVEKPEPEPETEAPEPELETETTESEPETEPPAPETEAPEPETEAPEPETEAPEPEPETEAPEPETEAPEPETEAPEESSESSSSSSSSSSESNETEPEGDKEFLPNGCPVNPHVHWLLPHETDCNLFYYCVWGEKVLRECPSTLHFNRVLQVCDWPNNAECALSANKHYGGRNSLFRK